MQCDENSAKIITAFGSYLVVAELLTMQEFVSFMTKVGDYVIEKPDWVSRSFMRILIVKC